MVSTPVGAPPAAAAAASKAAAAAAAASKAAAAAAAAASKAAAAAAEAQEEATNVRHCSSGAWRSPVHVHRSQLRQTYEEILASRRHQSSSSSSNNNNSSSSSSCPLSTPVSPQKLQPSKAAARMAVRRLTRDAAAPAATATAAAATAAAATAAAAAGCVDTASPPPEAAAAGGRQRLRLRDGRWTSSRSSSRSSSSRRSSIRRNCSSSSSSSHRDVQVCMVPPVSSSLWTVDLLAEVESDSAAAAAAAGGLGAARGGVFGLLLKQQQQHAAHAETVASGSMELGGGVQSGKRSLSVKRQHRAELARFVTAACHQEIDRSLLPFQVYRLQTTAAICMAWGLLLCVLGVCLLLFALHQNEVVIEYSSKMRQGAVLPFRVSRQLQPPLYVYYRIQDFYANFRPYVKDGPPETAAEALAVREVDGVQTLPSLAEVVGTGERLSGDKVTPESESFFPCGWQSVSLFNDVLEIKKQDGSEIGNVTLDTENVAFPWDFLQFMLPRTDWESEKLTPWVLPSDPRFRVWLHPPFTPGFQKLYAVSAESLEPDTQYYAVISTNLWPAEAWGASKAFVVASLTPMGGPNLPLALFCLFTAGL
ncbi:hypothetical protein Efla_000980 [Eimeria flavescens]